VSAAPAVPGRFGPYGGRYVPETLIAAHDELAEAYPRITATPALPARPVRPVRCRYTSGESGEE